MEINLIVVSKMTSEFLTVDKIIIPNVNNPILADLFDAAYDKYPTLQIFEDYRLFWRYAKSTFFEIFDYLSYVTALRLTVDMNIYLLLNDFGESWDDNISYLEQLDEMEERERKERERDIYDVKIPRKSDEEEVVEVVEKRERSARTDEEILCFAARKVPELRYYTTDLSRNFEMIADLSKVMMKGDIISCPHKDIYFLETNANSESTNLENLFASPAGREMVKYKPRTKLKQKLNPALAFFIHNKTSKATPQENKNNHDVNKCASSTTQSENQRSRRSSIDLYEEAATILGLTCAQTDNCKCIECQCHYFDFEEEIDFSTGGGGDYMVDHTSTCAIQ